MHYHLISSAGSGVLTPTLLGVIAGGRDASEADHATVAALLAGANDVESADIITGAERIAGHIAAHPDGERCFTRAAPDAALDWIRSPAAGAAGAVIACHRDQDDLPVGSLGVLGSFGAGYSIGSVILRKH